MKKQVGDSLKHLVLAIARTTAMLASWQQYLSINSSHNKSQISYSVRHRDLHTYPRMARTIVVLGCRICTALKHACDVHISLCHLRCSCSLLFQTSRIGTVFDKETSDLNVSSL